MRVITACTLDDPAAVLENCRKHIRIYAHDFLAYGARLSRLLLGDGSGAEQDFRQWLRLAPEWKDFVPLLINEAQRQRSLRPTREHGWADSRVAL